MALDKKNMPQMNIIVVLFNYSNIGYLIITNS